MAEIGNRVAAGADTTSVALKAVLGPILHNRARYQRLRAELGDGVSSSKESTFTYSAVKGLPFITACIKEGFRMHSSIVYQLPRQAPAEGISFDGHFLPPNATISMSALDRNRCQTISGTDTDTWRQERWLGVKGSSEDEVNLME
ncbi:uncharacterized protein DSM5745_08724 [Aspergillus mulundensis]|uniref:Cytochrome P450 n=1 Tax=Aspergillus mulundensis TaxID=1810919 RepID=A0A3D8R576_9EURO|nr:hypothetical protein DSM5745_08724 [Aspergillus mulundensis]RDW68964.1 hypothetical protein DSM5745_08724 [Aspergillus mulundensis]